MDLSEEVKSVELSKEQKVAMDKIAEAEKEYIKVVKGVTNNQLVNAKNIEKGLDRIIMGTMLIRRAISQPNEK